MLIGDSEKYDLIEAATKNVLNILNMEYKKYPAATTFFVPTSNMDKNIVKIVILELLEKENILTIKRISNKHNNILRNGLLIHTVEHGDVHSAKSAPSKTQQLC